MTMHLKGFPDQEQLLRTSVLHFSTYEEECSKEIPH